MYCVGSRITIGYSEQNGFGKHLVRMGNYRSAKDQFHKCNKIPAGSLYAFFMVCK